MSGIFGFFHIEGAPVQANDLQRMARVMERRGPDRTGLWHSDTVALGHTLLATTPESLVEHLPLTHEASGCVITADVRLDNRGELIRALGSSDKLDSRGDADLILQAYLKWGEACVGRFMGDFSFAIWDPRERRLFCARDHLGMRPFNYHHTPGRFFAFGSEPKVILLMEQTPYRINEGRIADFLLSNVLEGIDKTSTFFEELYRLPPAHTLTVSRAGLQIRRYWKLEPGPDLRLGSDEEYAEAFLDVFTDAVRSRLRSPGPVGSMLSGGVDSGSVVAVASALLAEAGCGPLQTFSAVGPDPSACKETRAIHDALTMGGLEPHMVDYTALDEYMPELTGLLWSVDEPFDYHMNLVRAVYLAGQRRGIKVMLDGVSGDVVLSEGTYLPRLIRRGRWSQVLGECISLEHFWGRERLPAWKTLLKSMRIAIAPDWMRRLRKSLWRLRPAGKLIKESLMDRDFVRRVHLKERLHKSRGHRSMRLGQFSRQRAEIIDHPNLTVARERYDRVAAALAIEPRDPFLDLRVVHFCSRLPGNQLLAGWPKMILRRAMADRLPNAVRWRRGKEHLGMSFTTAVTQKRGECLGILASHGNQLAPYVQEHALRAECNNASIGSQPELLQRVYNLSILALWLETHKCRSKLEPTHSSVVYGLSTTNLEKHHG